VIQWGGHIQSGPPPREAGSALSVGFVAVSRFSSATTPTLALSAPLWRILLVQHFAVARPCDAFGSFRCLGLPTCPIVRRRFPVCGREMSGRQLDCTTSFFLRPHFGIRLWPPSGQHLVVEKPSTGRQVTSPTPPVTKSPQRLTSWHAPPSKMYLKQNSIVPRGRWGESGGLRYCCVPSVIEYCLLCRRRRRELIICASH